MDSIFINHLKDLSQKADRNNRYTFTGFLTEEEQSELFLIKKEVLPFTLFGGAPGGRIVTAQPRLRCARADLRLTPLLCSLSGAHFIRNGRLILMQA